MADDDCPELVSAKVPVVILSGFLGSGKTTLLQYVLAQDHGLKIAVVVNEFDFGKAIEKGLTIKSSQVPDDDWVELNNGCLCCTSKTQSVIALESLIARKGSLDFILVETAGMADPAPVAAMFWQDDALQSCLTLAGIITVIDCRHIVGYLAPQGGYHEASQQILVADRLVFNKTDLVTQQELDVAVAAVAAINPTAERTFTSFSRLTNLDFLTGIEGVAHDAPEYLARKADVLRAAVDHHHASEVFAHQICFTGIATSKVQLETTFAQLLTSHDPDETQLAGSAEAAVPVVVRAKAAVWIPDASGLPRLWQLQSIGEYLDVVEMASSAGIAPLENRWLILGRNLRSDALTAHLKSGFVEAPPAGS